MFSSRKVLAAVAAAAALCVVSSAQASLFSLPRMLKSHSARIVHSGPTLPPLAHSRFCLMYPADCERHGRFEDRDVSLSQERWAELISINRDVNRSIVPQRNMGGVLTEEWLLSPAAGDCNDYAVTKRHELLARGWPASSLVLAEVVTTWGEHHLVLVVRTLEGDLVLDNLTPNVRPVSMTRYKWVRAQSPENPKFWSAIRLENAPAIAKPAQPVVRLVSFHSRGAAALRRAAESETCCTISSKAADAGESAVKAKDAEDGNPVDLLPASFVVASDHPAYEMLPQFP